MRKPSNSKAITTFVDKEIIEIVDTDTDTDSDTDTDTDEEVGGRTLALCDEVNPPCELPNTMRKPNSSEVITTFVDKEITEIVDADTNEVGGRMLALCGEVNTPCELPNTMRKPNNSEVITTFVDKEIIEIVDADTDEVGGRMLALCGEVNPSCELLNTMRKPNNSEVITTFADKEIIEIVDADTDEVGDRMLALCGEVNPLCKLLDTSGECGEPGRATSMQIVCLDDSDSGSDYDPEYKNYLTIYSGNGNLPLLEDNARRSSPMRLMYNVDNEASGRSKDKTETSIAGRKSKSPSINSVSKKLKTENGEADHASTRETRQKKEDARQGKKIALTKNTIKLDFRREKKSSVTKNNFKACKKEKEEEESNERRNAKYETISRASKRLKTENGSAEYNSTSRTIPVVNTKDAKRKKGEALLEKEAPVTKNNLESKSTRKERLFRDSTSRTISLVNTKRKKGEALLEKEVPLTKNNLESKSTRKERLYKGSTSRTIPVVNTKRKKGAALMGKKIPVTKKNRKSKSTSHVKDKLPHRFEARTKQNEESLSSLDKSYAYYYDNSYALYLAYLRNSVAINEPDDPDIIAISNYPFSYGGKSPFEADKDGKVIDLDDGIEPDANTSFSKKLMEILRKPYDNKEFSKLYNAASRKRPVTRSRQLRDGREIEYDVDDQLRDSYLERYPDFNKKLRLHRKDLPQALNLLRGFFFYLKHITDQDSFKPWLH